ncbi:MAG: type I restriction enzyme HsdR N-terminal domain-containing protein, partial [Caldisericia bacterium]|nr:type I restriction enzyme HsdR N-terminal domain-containing protein [Caldisericia bacterium]
MSAPEIIKKLVTRFDEFKDDYLKSSYKELQVCDEFINPMFEALGWDVHNKEGFSGKHQEVTQQYSLKIGGTTKAPDYAFKIGAGKPIFFVEAKKPSVDLKKDPKPAHQLRVYAWSSKLDISVLTDFQEFAIYDTRVRYHKDDPPSTARPFYTTYDKYIDRWDEIENILGRKNIPKNSIEKFLKKPPKHGAEPVDKVFLDTIELWRDNLAHNIFLYNNHLSVTDLNMVVQKTIDRILFLRICEDRGIENPNKL